MVYELDADPDANRNDIWNASLAAEYQRAESWKLVASIGVERNPDVHHGVLRGVNRIKEGTGWEQNGIVKNKGLALNRLTPLIYWLPGTYSCKNYRSMLLFQCKGAVSAN